jgi:hypothetical protein
VVKDVRFHDHCNNCTATRRCGWDCWMFLENDFDKESESSIEETLEKT